MIVKNFFANKNKNNFFSFSGFILRSCIVSVILCVIFFSSSLFCFASKEKYVVFISDWGKKEIPEAVLKIIDQSPNLKLAIPCPVNLKPSEELKSVLLKNKIEIPLTITQEPILPLIYDAKKVSQIEVDFSRPEDIKDIIMRSRDEANSNMLPVARGLYLNTGIFSKDLIPILKKLGIRWVNSKDSFDTLSGVYVQDDFFIFLTQNNTFLDAKECFNWIKSSKSEINVVFFDEENPLTPEFLLFFSKYLMHSDIKMVTPSEIINGLKYMAIQAEGINFEKDLSFWVQNPEIWKQLNEARQAIEDYKNSGQAKISTLSNLYDEIYKLYDFRLLEKLQVWTDPETEKIFQTAIDNIYSDLNTPRTGDNYVIDVSSSVETSPEQMFSVESSTYTLNIKNSITKNLIAIRKFSVEVTSETIIYNISVSTPLPCNSIYIDIYIDMNNQDGIGLTRFLKGADCFMEAKDAWEFALRIDGDKVYFYRLGRTEPVIIDEFDLIKPCQIEISKSILRGNPLQWGYQSVILEKNGMIDDFLCKDEYSRQNILKKKPIQLPAVRLFNGLKH